MDKSSSKTTFRFFPNLKDTYNVKNISPENTKKYSFESANKNLITDEKFPQKKAVMADVDNARILGDSNVILNKDSNACVESIVFNPNVENKVFGSNYLDYFKFENGENKFLSSKNNYFNEAIFIGSNLNFGHWLHNNLAKLIFFDDGEIELPIVINENTPKKYVECLKLIGIKEKNIIYLKAGEVSFFNKLYIPMMPWHVDYEGTLWWIPNSFKTLRKYFAIDRLDHKKELKIFISRNDTTHRRVENEDKIFNELEKMGFIRIIPSKLSIIEQVDLAGRASVVISPCGANSFLFLFMQDSAKLIELSPPHVTMDVTGMFAKKCNLDFRQVIGELSSTENKDPFSLPDSWFIEKNIDRKYVHDHVEFEQSDYNIDLNLILQELNDA